MGHNRMNIFKALRIYKGVTQVVLAKQIKTNPKYIGHLENSRTIPSRRLIERFAAYCEVPTWIIFYFLYDPQGSLFLPNIPEREEVLITTPSSALEFIRLYLDME